MLPRSVFSTSTDINTDPRTPKYLLHCCKTTSLKETIYRRLQNLTPNTNINIDLPFALVNSDFYLGNEIEYTSTKTFKNTETRFGTALTNRPIPNDLNIYYIEFEHNDIYSRNLYFGITAIRESKEEEFTISPFPYELPDTQRLDHVYTSFIKPAEEEIVRKGKAMPARLPYEWQAFPHEISSNEIDFSKESVGFKKYEFKDEFQDTIVIFDSWLPQTEHSFRTNYSEFKPCSGKIKDVEEVINYLEHGKDEMGYTKLINLPLMKGDIETLNKDEEFINNQRKLMQQKQRRDRDFWPEDTPTQRLKKSKTVLKQFKFVSEHQLEESQADGEDLAFYEDLNAEDKSASLKRHERIEMAHEIAKLQFQNRTHLNNQAQIDLEMLPSVNYFWQKDNTIAFDRRKNAQNPSIYCNPLVGAIGNNRGFRKTKPADHTLHRFGVLVNRHTNTIGFTINGRLLKTSRSLNGYSFNHNVKLFPFVSILNGEVTAIFGDHTKPDDGFLFDINAYARAMENKYGRPIYQKEIDELPNEEVKKFVMDYIDFYHSPTGTLKEIRDNREHLITVSHIIEKTYILKENPKVRKQYLAGLVVAEFMEYTVRNLFIKDKRAMFAAIKRHEDFLPWYIMDSAERVLINGGELTKEDLSMWDPRFPKTIFDAIEHEVLKFNRNLALLMFSRYAPHLSPPKNVFHLPTPTKDMIDYDLLDRMVNLHFPYDEELVYEQT